MTPDLQFLIKCCKTHPTATDIEQICNHVSKLTQLQLTEIISLAYIHGIFPLVYLAIKTHAAGLLSKENLTQLKNNNLNIVMHNLQMTAELIRINTLLQEHGIKVLAFKGPALAQLAYANISLRQFGDLDILIKKQDIRKAVALFINDQFIPEITLTENTQEAFFACVNVIGLEKNSRIEIHWELLAKNYAIDWQEKDLWKANDIINICGANIPIPAYNTHLLYLCVHGSKHLFERFEWVSDIDRLIRSKPEIEWQSLIQEAQEKGIVRIFLLGLYLCHTLLDLKLPVHINHQVLHNPAVVKLGNQIIQLNFSTSTTQQKSYGSFWLLWQMRENIADRLKFTIRGLFLPKFDDFKNLALPKQLIFLYPIIRPFRLLKKYL